MSDMDERLIFVIYLRWLISSDMSEMESDEEEEEEAEDEMKERKSETTNEEEKKDVNNTTRGFWKLIYKF